MMIAIVSFSLTILAAVSRPCQVFGTRVCFWNRVCSGMEAGDCSSFEASETRQILRGLESSRSLSEHCLLVLECFTGASTREVS